MARRRQGGARRAARWLGGAATAAAAFIAVEATLRLAGGAPAPEPAPAGFAYAHLDVARPFFGPKTVMVPRRPLAQPGQFDARKAPGTRRLFVVGGSVGQPFFTSETSAATDLWRQAFGGAPVELVNASMGGYDSARDLLTVREVLRYEPDLIVVLSGNNEAAEPPVARPRLAALNRALRRSASWRAVQDRFAPPRPAAGPWERFEANLRAMAREAKAAGVPLVFAALPTNLRDAAPDVTPPDDADFAAGRQAWERGQTAAAERAWRAFAARSPRSAAGAYWLARALDVNGKRDEAAGFYRAAADLETAERAEALIGPSNRCAPGCAEIIRRVAREEGAGLADLERAFAALADHGAPGLEHFRDACHWHHSFYPAVSLELLRAAAPAVGLVGLPDDRRLRRPRLTDQERADAAAHALRTGLAKALAAGRGPLSDAALVQLDLARRLSPDEWDRWTRSPEALAGLLEQTPAQPSSGWLRESAAAAPDVTWRYIDETRRRARRNEIARRQHDADEIADHRR